MFILSSFGGQQWRCALVLAVSATLACSGGESRPQASAVGGSVGNTGGSGNAAGGAGGGGAGSSAAAGASGAGGIGTVEAGSSGGAGDGGVAPLDTACDRSVAFCATGASFAFPTPKDLAAALGALTFDYNERPVTVVLAIDGGNASVGVSATEQASGASAPTFVAGKKPQFVPAAISVGGFATTATQTQAWLRVKDLTGFKDIELNNVDLSVVTSNQCSTMLALLTAVIPGSQGGVTLDLPSGSTTIGALAGGSSGGSQTPDAGSVGWNLRMMFVGESTDFDFKSL